MTDLNHVAVYVLPESNIADFVADEVSTNVLHSKVCIKLCIMNSDIHTCTVEKGKAYISYKYKRTYIYTHTENLDIDTSVHT